MVQTATQPYDPEPFLTELLHRTESLGLLIRDELARLKGVPFQVPGETEDHAAYRYDRNMNGTLSQLGEDVMLALLKLGLTDEEVGKRMSVSPNGVGARRRAWGRKPGQKG